MGSLLHHWDDSWLGDFDGKFDGRFDNIEDSLRLFFVDFIGCEVYHGCPTFSGFLIFRFRWESKLF